jgi:hypothetical protein
VGTAFWNQEPVNGPQPPSTAPITATSGTDLSNIVRQVLVQTTNDPLFCVAMGCTGSINLNGYSLNADGFDSSDTNYSVWNTNLQSGVYSFALRKANSVLATDAGITNVGNPGNLLVYGSINTGPGGETNAQQFGSVGDMTWVPTPGIQPGHEQDDMIVTFQNVSLPTMTPSQIGPINHQQPFPYTGYYEDSENGGLDHSIVIAAPNVSLYLVNGLDYDGYGYGMGNGHYTITVTNGSSATLYIGGQVNLGTGGNIVNMTGNAANLCIYGLTNLTSLNLGNIANFVSTIYAPQADVVLGNSGCTNQFTGSCIAKSITLNGPVNIHYDENLRRTGPYRAYVPISWTEF